MVDEDLSTSRIQPTRLDIARSQQAAAQKAAQERAMAQEVSEEGFQSWIDEGAFSPLVMARRFESLENKRKRTAKEEETEKAEKKEKVVQEIQKIEDISNQFNKKNPELQSRSLLLLRSRLSDTDTEEAILRKVLEMYPDYSLADDALDFLLQTTEKGLSDEVRKARERLNI